MLTCVGHSLVCLKFKGKIVHFNSKFGVRTGLNSQDRQFPNNHFPLDYKMRPKSDLLINIDLLSKLVCLKLDGKLVEF